VAFRWIGEYNILCNKFIREFDVQARNYQDLRLHVRPSGFKENPGRHLQV